jgi:pilus assembly protein TadC
MKKVYLFSAIAVVAVVMIVLSFMNFNPKVETWSSLIAGVLIGLLILGAPTIIAWFKNIRKQN